jgi:hypothetical protein
VLSRLIRVAVELTPISVHQDNAVRNLAGVEQHKITAPYLDARRRLVYVMQALDQVASLQMELAEDQLAGYALLGNVVVLMDGKLFFNVSI